MDRRTVLGLGAAAFTAMAAKAETMKADGTLSTDPTEVVPLWPGTPPGGEGVNLTAKIVERSPQPEVYHDRIVTDVSTPLMTVFRPTRPDGSALLLCPGGGYIREVLDKEGFEAARRLNGSGVTVFVLRYRLPGEGWAHAADVPLQDAQRAMRLIRANASVYGVEPNRIGAIGFSAGGHVAASLATRLNDKVYEPVDASDSLDARPAFAVLMYPVITMSEHSHTGSRERLLGADRSPERVEKYSCERHVTADTPPTFICYADDDDTVPPVWNGLAMYQALFAAKIPTELHAFQQGGHGFGIRLAQGKPCSVWPELLLHWGWAGGWFRDPSAAVQAA
jgi:acetyl esterase/lipase